MQPSNSCRIVVGRLVELDLSAGLRTEADLEAVIALARATFAQSPLGLHLVLIADWRACQVLAPTVAQRAAALMAQPIPRVERHATLHTPQHPTASLQLSRMVAEGNNPRRRLFTEVDAAESWLGEVLDHAERARLSLFLGRRA